MRASIGLRLAVLSCGLAACSVDAPILGPTVMGGTVVGRSKNAIERALALCDVKTAAAETACVRKALVDDGLGPAVLAAMIPGCKVGTICTLAYRTRDRSGLLAATATSYVADWVVTLDLRRPATPANIPLTVRQT